jgi:hypothetical protein
MQPLPAASLRPAPQRALAPSPSAAAQRLPSAPGQHMTAPPRQPPQQHPPATHSPSPSSNDNDRWIAIEQRLAEGDRERRAMQDILADLHADMRARRQHGAPQGQVHSRVEYSADSFGRSNPTPSPTPAADVGIHPTPGLGTLGNWNLFEAFVTSYMEYRAKARTDFRGEFRPVASLAHCYLPMHRDLASAFTGLAMRRARLAPDSSLGEAPPSFSASDIDQMDDDTFKRLFREMCAGSQLDRPSQVIEALADIQTPYDDGADLPYVMRMTHAFREKLESIPKQTLQRCTPEQLREAYLRAAFQSDWNTKAPDYVHCATWEHVRESLIQGATNNTVSFRAHRPPRNSRSQSETEEQALERRYNDLMASLDRDTYERVLRPDSHDERGIPRTWGSRFNELQRRIRQIREKERPTAPAPAQAAARSQAPPLQHTRPPDHSSAPITQHASDGALRSSPGHTRQRDPSPSGQTRSTSRPRFADGNCYRCGREGHRANQCSEVKDIYGNVCQERSRSASRDMPD